jgi:hypothetical protein
MYCVTCKKQTETFDITQEVTKNDITQEVTKNEKNVLCGKCVLCGQVKCQFVKTPSIRQALPRVVI